MAYEVNIIGEIIPFHIWDYWGGVTNLQVLEDQLKLANGDDIHVWIDSNGGDVDEGFKIYSALRRYAKDNSAKVITQAKGRCDSIATVVFLAGDERIANKFISPFFHNAWVYTEGDSKQLLRVAADLEHVNNLIANHYADHTDLTLEEAKLLMDENTALSPQECVNIRFATSIEELLRPAALSKTLNRLQSKNFNKNKMAVKNKKSLEQVLKDFFGGGAKNLVELYTADEELITFPNVAAGDEPKIGDEAEIDGNPAEGEHTLADGTTYIFSDGKLTEIRAKEDDDDTSDEEIQNLKKENEALKAQVAAQNKKINTIQSDLNEQKTTFQALKKIVSDYSAEGDETPKPNSAKNQSTSTTQSKGLAGAAQKRRDNAAK